MKLLIFYFDLTIEDNKTQLLKKSETSVDHKKSSNKNSQTGETRPPG